MNDYKTAIKFCKNGRDYEIDLTGAVQSEQIVNSTDDGLRSDVNTMLTKEFSDVELGYLNNPHLKPLNRKMHGERIEGVFCVNNLPLYECEFFVKNILKKYENDRWCISLKLEINRSLYSWVEKSKSCRICDLFDEEFTITYENLQDNFSNYPYTNGNDPFYFAPINNGQRDENGCVRIDEFIPVFYVLPILQRGFKKLDRSFKSEFLETKGRNLATWLIDPTFYEGGIIQNDDNEILAYLEDDVTFSNTTTGSQTVIFENDSVNGGKNLGAYSNTSGQFTMNGNGVVAYQVCLTFCQSPTSTPPLDPSVIQVNLIKNKSTTPELIEFDAVSTNNLANVADYEICLSGSVNLSDGETLEVCVDVEVIGLTYEIIMKSGFFDIQSTAITNQSSTVNIKDFIDPSYTLFDFVKGLKFEFFAEFTEGRTPKEVCFEPKYTTKIWQDGQELTCKGIFDLTKVIDLTKYADYKKQVNYEVARKTGLDTYSVTYCMKADSNDSGLETFEKNRGYALLSNQVIINNDATLKEVEKCNPFFAATLMGFDKSMNQNGTPNATPIMWNGDDVNISEQNRTYNHAFSPDKTYRFCPRLFWIGGLVDGEISILDEDGNKQDSAQYPYIYSYDITNTGNQSIGFGAENHFCNSLAFRDIELKELMQSSQVKVPLNLSLYDLNFLRNKRGNLFCLDHHNGVFRLDLLIVSFVNCPAAEAHLVNHSFLPDCCYTQQYTPNCDAIGISINYTKTNDQICIIANGVGDITYSNDNITFIDARAFCVDANSATVYIQQEFELCPTKVYEIIIEDCEIVSETELSNICGNCFTEFEFNGDPTDTNINPLGTDLALWNAQFGGGVDYTDIEVVGNSIRLCGGQNLDIGTRVFENFDNLVSVNDQCGILNEIGFRAFAECDNLVSFESPTAQLINQAAFANCPNISFICISNSNPIGIDLTNNNNFFGANSSSLTIKINPAFSLTAPTGDGDLDYHLSNGGTLIY